MDESVKQWILSRTNMPYRMWKATQDSMYNGALGVCSWNMEWDYKERRCKNEHDKRTD